ncbi:MAG: AI-2E family transporter [Elusimicrobia bacterium]|nr:AI-2E family transporter [Elusimicrobiota bacterium]
MLLTGEKKSLNQFIIPLLIVAGCVYLVSLAKEAFFPLLLSAALAYVLYPAVKYFEARGIKRIYAVAGLYITFGIIVVSIVYILSYMLYYEIDSIQKTWPVYAERMQSFIINFNRKLAKAYPILKDINLSGKVLGYLQEAPGFLLGILPALGLFIIVPFITFFILLGGPNTLDYLLDHVPSKYVEIILHIVSVMDESLGNYLRGILTEAVIIFVIAFAGLTIMELNYASAIAVIIGISSMVPYAGAIVGAIISSIVAYFQYDSLIYVIKIILFFAALRFVDDWFIQPYIMKKAVKLNPAIVIFALMAGFEIGGIWGVIFSIPVTCIIKDLIHIAVEFQETEFHWKPNPEPTRISIPYT